MCKQFAELSELVRTSSARASQWIASVHPFRNHIGLNRPHWVFFRQSQRNSVPEDIDLRMQLVGARSAKPYVLRLALFSASSIADDNI
jgi:hypothetical protein